MLLIDPRPLLGVKAGVLASNFLLNLEDRTYFSSSNSDTFLVRRWI